MVVKKSTFCFPVLTSISGYRTTPALGRGQDRSDPKEDSFAWDLLLSEKMSAL